MKQNKLNTIYEVFLQKLNLITVLTAYLYSFIQ